MTSADLEFEHTVITAGLMDFDALNMGGAGNTHVVDEPAHAGSRRAQGHGPVPAIPALFLNPEILPQLIHVGLEHRQQYGSDNAQRRLLLDTDTRNDMAIAAPNQLLAGNHQLRLHRLLDLPQQTMCLRHHIMTARHQWLFQLGQILALREAPLHHLALGLQGRPRLCRVRIRGNSHRGAHRRDDKCRDQYLNATAFHAHDAGVARPAWIKAWVTASGWLGYISPLSMSTGTCSVEPRASKPPVSISRI